MRSDEGPESVLTPDSLDSQQSPLTAESFCGPSHKLGAEALRPFGLRAQGGKGFSSDEDDY